MITPYGVNVGVDVNHYRPMSCEKMLYYSNLTDKCSYYYDK